MKKTILTLLMLFITTSILFAEEYTIEKFEAPNNYIKEIFEDNRDVNLMVFAEQQLFIEVSDISNNIIYRTKSQDVSTKNLFYFNEKFSSDEKKLIFCVKTSHKDNVKKANSFTKGALWGGAIGGVLGAVGTAIVCGLDGGAMAIGGATAGAALGGAGAYLHPVEGAYIIAQYELETNIKGKHSKNLPTNNVEFDGMKMTLIIK